MPSKNKKSNNKNRNKSSNDNFSKLHSENLSSSTIRSEESFNSDSTNKSVEEKSSNFSTLNSGDNVNSTEKKVKENTFACQEKCFQPNPNFKPKSKKFGSIFFPIVSVCTPTFNRRPFIPIMFECFKNQNYPKTAIEWIIVDDGTDTIEDLIKESNIENIKYFKLSKKMPLGEKRNFMHTRCSGSIIVYMDDDDYYPPERISHAVERLNNNKEALCAGSSEIYIYFKHISKMIQCGPYMPNHATAGTFAFRVELLKQTQYENHAALAEEKAFLKNYTIPFVQLDPMKTILVFSHNHNSFDKKKLLENMHPEFCKESPKKVEDFIRRSPLENNIKQFFVNDIDELLKVYSPGEPSMKPDVLKDIKRIEKEREEMNKKQMEEESANQSFKILFQQEGMPPIELQPTQIVELLQQNQNQMQMMMQKINEQEQIIQKLQEMLIKHSP